MKILRVSVIIMSFFAFFTACKDESSDTRQEYEQQLADFETWVEETEKTAIGNGKRMNWEELDQEFENQQFKLTRHEDEMNDKAKAKMEHLQNRYQNLKDKNTTSGLDHKAVEEKQHLKELRQALKLEGDNQLESITAGTLVESYRKFVNSVDRHKELYTSKDWKEVDYLWDSLNSRKNELEDQVSRAENREIAKQKLEYGSIKAAYNLSMK